MTMNDGQMAAYRLLQHFVDHPSADTFVLMGYAGTGKTFLVQQLAQWLQANQYEFSLLASTGRAATVLRGKTGLTAKTVHSHLYQFEELIEAQLTLSFALREPEKGKRIYIIDESSMLSNLPPKDPGIATFGSGRLLDDLFAHAKGHKVIFVGDPGQLPPVSETGSPALDLDWLLRQQRTTLTATLEKIERTGQDNDILTLAGRIRGMAAKGRPKLPAARLRDVELFSGDKRLFQHYLNRFKDYGPHHTIAIARSNRMVSIINRALRRDLHQQLDRPLQPEEVLLVTQNNPGARLTNGDFVQAAGIGQVLLHAGLHFQEVRIRSLVTGAEQDMLLSLDILYGKEQNFSREQQQRLMADFNRRMKHIALKPNTAEYNDRMRTDRYMNCLRARYGYAVTCHKAQGGEWDHVYLFLEESMYRMPADEMLRWWYTAVTRAKKRLHLTHRDWIA